MTTQQALTIFAKMPFSSNRLKYNFEKIKRDGYISCGINCNDIDCSECPISSEEENNSIKNFPTSSKDIDDFTHKNPELFL